MLQNSFYQIRINQLSFKFETNRCITYLYISTVYLYGFSLIIFYYLTELFRFFVFVYVIDLLATGNSLSEKVKPSLRSTFIEIGIYTFQ